MRPVLKTKILYWVVPAMMVTGLFSVPAIAQSLNITSGGENGGPVEILADDGIEWRQDDNIFIARGNAQAIRDTVTVSADLLRIYYYDNLGATEIW